jgi:uncharacterized protein (TIGR02679 family)
MEKFNKAFIGTKLEGLELEKVLMLYFDEDIVSKKNEKAVYDDLRNKVLMGVVEEFKDTKAYQWLNSLAADKKYGYSAFVTEYSTDTNHAKLLMEQVGNAINILTFSSNELIRLAVMASKTAKNPHAFDKDTTAGRLFLHALCYYANKYYPDNAEEYAEVLYLNGVISDEVSNYCTCSGLIAYNKEVTHPGWLGFYEALEPMQINLINISKVDYVACERNEVFVFENPTVFTDVYEATKQFRPALICSNGQPRLCTLILLDKLVREEGKMIYYSGDFDVDGLKIADRLKVRYGDNFRFWNYEDHHYNRAISNKILSDERLGHLSKLRSRELIGFAELLRDKKRPGYQELLIDCYIADILDSCNI